MVRMVVRVDQRPHRLLRDLVELGFDGLRALHGPHDVDDEHALIALDHDRVRDPKAYRLIDPLGDGVYGARKLLGLTFERGVDLRLERNRLRIDGLRLMARAEQADRRSEE